MRKPVYFQPLGLIFSVVMIAMAIVSYRYDHYVFIFEITLSVTAAVIIIFMDIRYRKYVDRVVRGTISGIKGVNHTYLEKFSVPVVVTGTHGDIVWYNTKFRRRITHGKECSGESVSVYIPGTNIYKLLDGESADIHYDGRRYTVLASEVEDGVVLYYIDDTEYKITTEKYHATRPVVATIVLDNRDEFERSDDDSFTQAVVMLESVIKRWVSSCGGLYIKASSGRYKAVIDETALKKTIESRFKILEEVRGIKIANASLMTTISVGIGHCAANFSECERWSLQALDMALGRGGDQAAVKMDDDYEFFGGVSKGVEKHEKVKARVISKALEEKISQSDNVYIMGHQNSDLDAVGAAIGMWSAVSKTFDNYTRVVINEETSLAEVFLTNFVKKGYKNTFISPEEAKKHVNEKTLLIIVDTHSPTFVEDPELYAMCKNVVVIDHHRMMVNHINNACVFFHEPFASSASEMVTELVQYINDDALNRSEAEALLAGIMLDTKNFVLRTGVRTFEAAAYLKRKGADTVEVKRLFSDSLDTYKTKSQLVSEAEIYNFSAIASTDDKMSLDKDIRMTAAQAADELLSIQDVQASYVIYKQGTDRCISARSLGDLNVQLVMERLGGGGHQTMAGTNLGDISAQEAREKLVVAIDAVTSEAAAAKNEPSIKRRNL